MDFQYLLKKIVTERRAELSEMLMSNGIASMEQYQNVMGQLSALAHVEVHPRGQKKHMQTLLHLGMGAPIGT